MIIFFSFSRSSLALKFWLAFKRVSKARDCEAFIIGAFLTSYMPTKRGENGHLQRLIPALSMGLKITGHTV